MTQHSSLKGASVSVKHRNVLKRYERLRALKEGEKWEDRKSVYNLPKLKMIKLKVKKTKGPKEEGESAAGEGSGEGATAEKTTTKAKPKAKG
jgi:small basic protein (TIGR04137 family)